MAFGAKAQSKTYTPSDTTQVKIPHMRLEDKRVFRILDEEEHVFYRYFMEVNIGGDQKTRVVIVGGRDNPVQRFLRDVRNVSDFNMYPQRMYAFNVYDRTPVVKHNGRTYYADAKGAFPTETEQGESLKGIVPAPNNEVRFVEVGRDVLGLLAGYDGLIDAPDAKPGEPKLRLQDFDFTLTVTKVKSSTPYPKKNYTPIPGPDLRPLSAEVLALPRYDLEEIYKPFTDEMLERILQGDDYVEVLKEANRLFYYPFRKDSSELFS